MEKEGQENIFQKEQNTVKKVNVRELKVGQHFTAYFSFPKPAYHITNLAVAGVKHKDTVHL